MNSLNFFLASSMMMMMEEFHIKIFKRLLDQKSIPLKDFTLDKIKK